MSSEKDDPNPETIGHTQARASTRATEAMQRGTRASKATRIDWIIERMIQIPSAWDEGARREARELFDVADGTLENDAAEASRYIERQKNDPQLRAAMEASLEDAREGLQILAADDKVHPRDRVAAHRAVIEANAVWAQLRGVEATKKIDVGGTLAEFLALGNGPTEGAPKE